MGESLYSEKRASEFKPLFNRLLVLFGLAVFLIGLGGVLGNVLHLDWLRSYSYKESISQISMPVSVAILFLGVGIKVILDSHPYESKPHWLWLFRYLGFLVPGGLGLYWVIYYLVLTHGDVMAVFTYNITRMPVPFMTAMNLLLNGIILFLFLKWQRSEKVVVYGVCALALIEMNMCLFALVGHKLDIAILYNYKMSILSAIAFLLAGIAVQIGTLPFKGLFLPVFSPSIRSRFIALGSIVASIGILFLSIVSVSTFNGLYPLAEGDPAHRHLLMSMMFFSIVLSVLGNTLALRAIHYYNVSAFFAEEQRLARNREAVVNKLISAVHRSLDMEKVFQCIVDVLGGQLQCDRCFIARFDEENDTLSPPTREYRSGNDIPSMIGSAYKMSSDSQGFLLEMACRHTKDKAIQEVCHTKITRMDPTTPGLTADIREYFKEIGIQSGLACAIMYHNHCMALLFIHQVNAYRVWTPEEEELVRIGAGQAAIAIYQAKLYQTEQETSQSLAGALKRESALRQAMQLVSQTFDINLILETMSQEIMQAMRVDRCIIVNTGVESPDIPQFLHQATSTPDIKPVEWDDIPRRRMSFGIIPDEDGSLCNLLVKAEGFDNLPVQFQNYVKKYRIQSVLGFEICYRNQSYGRVVVHQCTAVRHWTRDDIALLDALVAQLGTAMYQSKLYHESQEARIQAEEANLHKTQALAHMSHELRTPLNAIIGYSDMIQKGMAASVDKQLRYAGNISLSGRHLLDLINELLDVTKLEAGKLEIHPEPTDVGKIAHGLLEIMQPLAQEKHLQLQWDIASDIGLVEVDPARFRQILFNLLSNAVKFNRPSGWLKLRLHREAEWLVGEVSDKGIGIPQDKLGRLFTEFYQVGQQNGGTGLGLALTKRLVEVHGGTITVESTEGEGSVFRFRLPAQARVMMSVSR